MQKILLITTVFFAFIFKAVAKDDEIPLSKDVEKTILDHLKTQLFLKKHEELGHSFGDVFKEVKVYKLWRKSVQGSSTIKRGMQLHLVVHGKIAKVFEHEAEMKEYLLELYGKPLASSADVERVFKALGPVEEVIKKGNKYHVFTGKKFFGSRSRYELSTDSRGNFKSCEFVNKLAK